MTREEAIKILKTERYCQEDTPNLKRVRKAYDMAIEALQICVDYGDTWRTDFNNITKSQNEAIKSQNDVIEVVRCKDCVWSKEWNDKQIFCDRILMRLRANDFCSYGERRK